MENVQLRASMSTETGSEKIIRQSQETADWTIPLEETDVSKLRLLSEYTAIPVPLLCRALIRVMINQDSPQKIVEQLFLIRNQSPNNISFSKREHDVLKLMGLGMANQEIANTLDLSVQTIKNHVSSIFRKINARNRTQAVLMGLNKNIKESVHKEGL